MTDGVDAAAGNMFVFSVLTIFALACPRKEDGFLLISDSGFPKWLYLLRGTRMFIATAQAQPEVGVLAPLFTHGADRWMLRETSTAPTACVHQQLDNMASLIKRRQPDEQLRSIYLRAIEELHKSFSVDESGSDTSCDITDAFVWIHEVVDDLLPQLHVPTQEAVAIFAFFSVLFKRTGDQWYMHGWADHLIAKAYSILDEEHRLWIQWPLKEMGWPQ